MNIHEYLEYLEYFFDTLKKSRAIASSILIAAYVMVFSLRISESQFRGKLCA
jgi:hypothetical protein